MNILIEIGHPAHVHFFAKSILRLSGAGHKVIVVTRNKEMTNALLDRFQIPYISLSQPAGSNWSLIRELIGRWIHVFRLVKAHQIQLAASISGISTSIPARLSGIRNILFHDTEDAIITNSIAFPFADKIYTPAFFLKDIGPKQVRYQGLHELSYLQNFPFDQIEPWRRRHGLSDRYVVVRLVANDALHDRGISGLDGSFLEKLLRVISRFGQVYLTSQKKLGPEFSAYQPPIPIEEIHHLLAGAYLFVGDSPTMAVESSLLGVPAFLSTPRWSSLGNMVCLSRDYDLLKVYSSWMSLLEQISEPKSFDDLRLQWQTRAKRFRESLPNMQNFIWNSLVADPNSDDEKTSCAA